MVVGDGRVPELGSGWTGVGGMTTREGEAMDVGQVILKKGGNQRSR